MSEKNPNHSSTEKELSKTPFIRQDRYELPEGKNVLLIDDKTYELCDYSSFGVAIYSTVSFNSISEITNASLYIEDIEIGEFHLKKVRQEELSDNSFKVAFEILNTSLSTAKVNVIIKSKQLINDVISKRANFQNVPENFKKAVYDVKDILQELDELLEELTDSNHLLSRAASDEFEDTVSTVVSKYLLILFSETYKSLSESLLNVTETQVKASVEFFRFHLEHLINKAPFAERAFKKPLRYAGDYEMMNILYRDETIGDTLFAKCMQRYFLNNPEAKAVRNRARYLYDRISTLIVNRKDDRKLKLLSVASGPAMEIQLILKENNSLNLENVEFDLLDQDLISLKHAQLKIREYSRSKNKKIKTNFINREVKDLVRKGLLHAEYDLIYSAGLFDYFPDAFAQMSAQVLFKAIKPGGQLIIGNFNLLSTNRAMMDLAFDWKLYYRTHEDLTDLFGELGGDLVIEEEKEGINLFCVITKKIDSIK
jgi:hypothetical protein